MESHLVRWSTWPKVGPVIHGKMPREKMQEHIQRFEIEAKKVLEETGADHVLYARKLFTEDGELEEVRFYMLPMTDEEFEKRVVPIPRQQVYALHKRK